MTGGNSMFRHSWTGDLFKGLGWMYILDDMHAWNMMRIASDLEPQTAQKARCLFCVLVEAVYFAGKPEGRVNSWVTGLWPLKMNDWKAAASGKPTWLKSYLMLRILNRISIWILIMVSKLITRDNFFCTLEAIEVVKLKAVDGPKFTNTFQGQTWKLGTVRTWRYQLEV